MHESTFIFQHTGVIIAFVTVCRNRYGTVWLVAVVSCILRFSLLRSRDVFVDVWPK